MARETVQLLAIFAAYTTSFGLWFWLTRKAPATWVEPREVVFPRPRLELALAIGAMVGVFVLSVVYSRGGLVPKPENPSLSSLVFLLNLTLIWSPIFLLLVLRHHSLSSCFFSVEKLWIKISWGVLGSLIGISIYSLIVFRGSVSEGIGRALAETQWIDVAQGLIQYLGFGFLLYRWVAATGRVYGILVIGILYGLVKYPYYMLQLEMEFFQASGLILFSSVVAVVMIYFILDRQDMITPALIHVFLDAVQR